MKTILNLSLVSLSLAFAHASFGQATSTNPSTGNLKPQLSTEELESRFKSALTNATFTGRWCSVADGKMGEQKEDKYTLQGVSKVGGDSWIVYARIQYGQRDFVAPIPVQVKWAGDTPVIIVNDLAMPGGTNRYSARVLVHDGTYAGRWSGGNQGGLLNGVISQRKD